MALSSAFVWEMRPSTGNNSNGGAFKAGATGTDYSQQNAAQITWLADGGTYTNDLASVDGSTVLTSASYSFTASDVGNIINITAGTNDLPGRYEIVSVNAGQATLDRDCADAGDMSAATGYLGGAISTIDGLFSAAAVCEVVAGNTIYIANTNNNTTVHLATTARTLTSGTITASIHIIGYDLYNGGTNDGIRTNLTSLTYDESHTANGFLDTTTAGQVFPQVYWTGNWSFTSGSFTFIKYIRMLSTGRAASAFIQGIGNKMFRCALDGTINNASASTIVQGGDSILLDCDFSSTYGSGSATILSAVGCAAIGCRIKCGAGAGFAMSTNRVVLNGCLIYNIADAKAGVTSTATAGQQSLINCTLDGAIGSTTAKGVSLTGVQATAVFSAINCIGTNLITFISNDSGVAIRLDAFNNRILNCTNDYTGFLDNDAAIGDDYDDSGTMEYVDRDTQDYRLLSTSTARGMGVIPYMDAGWLQRQEPVKLVNMSGGCGG